MLLLEAGGTPSLLTSLPTFTPAFQLSSYDWQVPHVIIAAVKGLNSAPALTEIQPSISYSRALLRLQICHPCVHMEGYFRHFYQHLELRLITKPIRPSPKDL